MPTTFTSCIMHLLPFSPSTTPLQATTYLLFISLFSISFLVFLNSAVSFVITDLIGQKSGVGDIVGTLGFADELVALVMCPIWGLLSDRLGVRWVAVLGYAIVSVSLVVFVQARNVYPQLLLARVFFAMGATASATMVTAILPSLTDSSTTDSPSAREKPSILAGFVGLFTGCGALVALTLFLPLPAHFAEQDGLTQGAAVARSFYVVGAVALVVSLFVSFGLRRLKGEEGKGWKMLWNRPGNSEGETHGVKPLPYGQLIRSSVRLGFLDANIGLGYIGGFVARASTVAISLFVPLFVNTFFIHNGFCHGSPHDPSPELKKECRTAYILASILTGVAQMMGLIYAPIFGYLARRPGKWNIPLVISTVCGIIGYTIFPLLQSPEMKDVDGRGGSAWIFLVVSLMGISQIGVIVCSLGSLGRGVIDDSTVVPAVESVAGTEASGETAPLLVGQRAEVVRKSRIQLKGSIAGVYSWCGGAAILLLTKVGGFLFDKVSNGAPFYMMAGFNGVLLLAVLAVDVAEFAKGKTVALRT